MSESFNFYQGDRTDEVYSALRIENNDRNPLYVDPSVSRRGSPIPVTKSSDEHLYYHTFADTKDQKWDPSKINHIYRPSEQYQRFMNEKSHALRYLPDGIDEHKKWPYHFGQRKLLLSEVEFLSKTYPLWKDFPEINIIYVGAGPGDHLPMMITNMFHNMTGIKTHMIFHLYDSHYNPILLKENGFFQQYASGKTKVHSDGTSGKITVIPYTKYFTDDEIDNLFIGKKCLLISDIRNLDFTKFTRDDTKTDEETLLVDLNLQMGWHLKLQPVSSMLKFRLPFIKWVKGEGGVYSIVGNIPRPVPYLKGVCYFQCWQGRLSNETRMHIIGNEIVTYVPTDYEDKMFYFNKITRRLYYDHNVKGYCHCYDCFSEIHIIREFLRVFEIDKYRQQSTRSFTVNDQITYIGSLITQKLGDRYKLFNGDRSSAQKQPFRGDRRNDRRSNGNEQKDRRR